MYVAGIASERVSTVPLFDVGQLGASADDGTKIYQYVQASGSMGKNKVAQIRPNYQAVVSTTERPGASLGVTEVAFANNEYGWLQVFGQAVGMAGGTISTAQAVALNLDSAEAGDIVPGTLATPEILGMFAVSAISNNATGTLQLNFPILRA